MSLKLKSWHSYCTYVADGQNIYSYIATVIFHVYTSVVPFDGTLRAWGFGVAGSFLLPAFRLQDASCISWPWCIYIGWWSNNVLLNSALLPQFHAARLIIILWAHHASTLFKIQVKGRSMWPEHHRKPVPTCVAAVSAVTAAGHCQWWLEIPIAWLAG